MLRSITRSGVSSLRAARSANPSTKAQTFKRFSHDDHHHAPEYPPEYLFKKTSIFVGVFSIVLGGLLYNDRVNSKTGKSMVGDWLIPTSDRAGVEAAEDEKQDYVSKLRADAVFQRKVEERPAFSDHSIMPVSEPGPRSVPTGSVIEFENISERRPRSTYP